jgi:hypothetical protein
MATPRAGRMGRKDPNREYKVMVRLNRDEALRIKRCADTEKRPLSQWARIVLMQYVEGSELSGESKS